MPTVAVALPCWDLQGWLGPEHGWVCPTQLRQLEMQLEQEHEQKQMVLHEKQDLEGLIGTLCEQVRGQCPPRAVPCPKNRSGDKQVQLEQQPGVGARAAAAGPLSLTCPRCHPATPGTGIWRCWDCRDHTGATWSH